MLSSGLSLLYAPHLLRQPNRAQDLKRKVSELYETVTKSKIPSHVHSLVLDFMCKDLEGNDVEDVPFIKYKLQKS
ncbi:unnamed protein product [Adineta steineri]|nr:unnamed protein product [Adineta steineri]